MLPQSNQSKGLLIAALGVLALTPDTLLVRLAHLDSTTLLFWRGLATLIGMSAVTLLQHGRDTAHQFRQIGKTGIGVGLLMGCSSCCFVMALYYTSVANTLVILSSSPIFAALYSRVFLKERVAGRTIISIIVVITAISFIVGDSEGSTSLLGNCIALCAAMCMSAGFTMMRSGKKRNMIPATALGGIILICVGASLAPSLALSWQQAALIVCMGVSSAAGFIMITMATRYISSPEVSLLMPIETVLASYIVWLVLGEAPATITIIGGIVIISTLSLHSLLSLRSIPARPLD
ncbi:DMT family transporter [Desulfotalea psychrophila]|uniref:EamA domain-containing protein n=1 Tax=Desulfotalea psychrophila (strain LSv54 / DSM 12343) TaxID=177439 RepID=Q6ASD9_DESPS|nr:DMT family transporter [Desulfotalea psychrophila]CAG34792.1 unknown protein [Desulfotalea psychrophila LSv54]